MTPNSYAHIWIHAVWATHNREPFITVEIEQILFPFIRNELNKLECSNVVINGMPDHVHCLFRMRAIHSVSQILKQIKGSSARFVNKSHGFKHFYWQPTYAAFSVSPHQVHIIRHYIFNQKIHHSTNSFEKELSILDLESESP